MTWKGESRRHSLARRGIKTASGSTSSPKPKWNWKYTKIEKPKIMKVKVIPHVFGGEEIIEIKVTPQMYDYLQTLPEYAIEGIIDYSRATHGYINQYILGVPIEKLNPYPDMNKKITKKNLDRWIAGIDLFLEKADKMEGTAYRGLRFYDQESMDNFIGSLGDMVHFDEYLSTTTKHNVKGFLRDQNAIELEIESDKFVFLDGVSRFPFEEEFLLPRDMIFNVKDIQKTDFGYKVKLKELG